MARILGLDIERHCLRGALIRTSFRRAEVEQYVEVQLSEELDGPARNADIKTALPLLFQQLDRPADSVVTSIDGRAVSLRKVSLPSAVAKRVDDVLPFEMESLLPFEMEDALLAHQPAGAGDGQLELLVAAILESRLQQELESLGAVGVAPRQLVPSAVALEGLVALDEQQDASGAPLVIIELRRQTTEICILRAGKCQTARTLSDGADDLPGAGDTIAKGVQQTLASFRALGGEEPSYGVVLGHGSRAVGVDQWLSEQLGMPIELGQLPKPTGGEHGDASFGLAFSLAARASRGGTRINLLRGRFAAVDTGGGLAARANLLMTCAVAVLVCFMFSMWAQQSLLLDERRALSEQLAATTKEVFGRSASSVAAAEKLMKSPGSTDPLPRFDAYDALAALSGSVAEDIKHSIRRLRVEVADDKREGKLELQGSLSSIEQRDAIIAALAAHPCFSEIEAGRTTPARGQEAINYQVEAVVQCPGDGTKKKKKK